MKAGELREVVRDVLLELDPRADRRPVNSLLERAARGKSGWPPRARGHGEVAEMVAFVQAAQRIGYADPWDIDERLNRKSAAKAASPSSRDRSTRVQLRRGPRR
jgi:hypothetical protein